MKSAVKKWMTKFWAISPDRVIAAIEKADCKAVSFDIFDTLIKRNVPTPQDVFLLLEKQYQRHFGRSCPIYELRCQAEARAIKRLGRIEVNLSEIYQTMEEISEAEREWLMAEEIRIERAICQRWQPMGKVYDWCMSKGIPVILVSDMYLPHDVITELLHAAGYSGWKRLYISAEDHANKAHGTLFDIVLREEHLKPEELVHIGDSLRGDYLAPKGKGIQAVLIAEKSQRRYCDKKEIRSEKKQGLLSYQIIDSVVKNNIDQYDGYFQRFGYNVVGPILYGYCKWLADKVKQADIEKVFFLAREGYFLKRGFDLLDNQNVNSHVIQVSRKATVLPRLYKAEDLDALIRMTKFEHYGPTIKKLLTFCGIQEASVHSFLEEHGLSVNATINELAEKEKEALFKYIKPIIDQVSRAQENNLKGYLAQFGFSGQMAISDVGWIGTIQHSLQTIFPDDKLIGYYVGKEEKLIRPKVDSSAFLFDNRTNHEIFQAVMGSKDLFELFFLSVEGSASHYERNREGKYVCVELPPEQTEESARFVLELQDAACAFVQDFKHLDDILHIEFGPFASSGGYRAFVKHIRNHDIKELKRFSFFNVMKRSLVAEHCLGWYLLRPKCFVQDFLNNGCKVLFLKSVFKVPLPYVQLVDLYRRLVECWRRHERSSQLNSL